MFVAKKKKKTFRIFAPTAPWGLFAMGHITGADALDIMAPRVTELLKPLKLWWVFTGDFWVSVHFLGHNACWTYQFAWSASPVSLLNSWRSDTFSSLSTIII